MHQTTSSSQWLIPLLLLCLGWAGCQRVREIPGGTRGLIEIEGQPVANIRVNVFPVTGDSQTPAEPIAFGITDERGQFELREIETLGAAWLEFGEYRFTVESQGEIPLTWPAEFSDPKKTPLSREWSSEGGELKLSLPAPRTRR